MFSYRIILKKAWQHTWKYKYLWLFGLFAALTSAGGSWEYSLLSQSFGSNIIESSYLQLEKIISIFETGVSFGAGFWSVLTSNIWNAMNMITVLILMGLFFFIFIWLSITSQGALVNSVKKLLTGKKKMGEFSYREHLTVGHKNFWPIFAMNILIKLFITLAFFIISIPLLILALKDIAVLGFIYIILFVIFVIIATGFSLMIKYAISFQIFEEAGFVESIKKAYHLFRNNWLISLEMAIILFIVSFLAGLGFALLASVVLLPLFITSIALSMIWLTWVVIYLGIILVILFGSILTTFQISAWTELFFHLKEQKGSLPKLERLVRK